MFPSKIIDIDKIEWKFKIFPIVFFFNSKFYEFLCIFFFFLHIFSLLLDALVSLSLFFFFTIFLIGEKIIRDWKSNYHFIGFVLFEILVTCSYNCTYNNHSFKSDLWMNDCESTMRMVIGNQSRYIFPRNQFFSRWT